VNPWPERWNQFASEGLSDEQAAALASLAQDVVREARVHDADPAPLPLSMGVRKRASEELGLDAWYQLKNVDRYTCLALGRHPAHIAAELLCDEMGSERKARKWANDPTIRAEMPVTRVQEIEMIADLLNSKHQ
jgi:hypothetical protein